MAPVLNEPNEPVSDLSYFDCLDLVIEKSKVKCTCVYMYVYMCVHACVHVHVYLHVYRFVCVYVCVCVYLMCVYTYVHKFDLHV